MNEVVRSEQPTWESVLALRDEQLRRSKNAAGARSIQRVVEACETLAKGGNAITIASVGKFCVTTFDGPKAQSISNNRDLADLVRMAASVHNPVSGANRKSKRPWEDEILLHISDPHVRSQVQIALVERRSLIGEVGALKDNFKRLKAIQGLTPVLATADIQTLEQLAEAVRSATPLPLTDDFSEEEKAACHEFLERGVGAEGWIIDEGSGEIQTKATRRPVARRGLVSALRKIASGGRNPEGEASS